MGAIPVSTFISVDDYLIMEEEALEKHEYYKGEVFAMAGAGISHNRIVRNSMLVIGNYLQDKKCEILPSDMRIQIEANSLFTYPDLTIFCEALEMYKDRTDTATNPTVIIEVLSKSTQDYDRGSKFKLYRDIPSLKEYILISSTEILLEQYIRVSANEWQFYTSNKADEKFSVSAIDLTIQISDLYRGVEFEK